MEQVVERDPILDLDARRRIYVYIQKCPGVHERELSRELGIPLSTLDYHLFHLKKRTLIDGQQDGRYTRYFITKVMNPRDKKVIGILRQRTPRRIILFLLLHSSVAHKQVSDYLQIAPSTTSFHLRNLLNAEVVERRVIMGDVFYSIRNPEYLTTLLITYRRSFLDTAVDRFLTTWTELHPTHLKRKKKNNRGTSLLLVWFSS